METRRKETFRGAFWCYLNDPSREKNLMDDDTVARKKDERAAIYTGNKSKIYFASVKNANLEE